MAWVSHNVPGRGFSLAAPHPKSVTPVQLCLEFSNVSVVAVDLTTVRHYVIIRDNYYAYLEQQLSMW